MADLLTCGGTSKGAGDFSLSRSLLEEQVPSHLLLILFLLSSVLSGFMKFLGGFFVFFFLLCNNPEVF